MIICILMLLIISILISNLCDRRIEDVIPPTVFCLLIILYGVAILGRSHHSFEGSVILFAAIWLFYIIKKKRFFPTLTHIRQNVLTGGFITYLAVLVLLFVAYGNHFVMVWDDFHYNATFPKDMYYYGTMPSGNHSATFYRSYPPLMQLFFYWGFLGERAFSEPLMFRFKMLLIYTCLLPLYRQISYKTSLIRSILTAVATTVLPFLFMYELMESLSMDTFMALLFAYALLGICRPGKKDTFTYAQILLSLSCLTLVKQIAPVLTATALFIWAATDGVLYIKKHDRKDLVRSFVIPWCTACGTVFALWYSWRVFCRIKGNSVYLSEKLLSSIGPSDGGTGPLIDAKTTDTITAYLKALITCRLNLEKNGLTLAGTFLILLICSVVMIRVNRRRINIAGIASLTLGLAGYLAVILYTYLFVFEDWEAASLSSIDRYLGTYALVLMCLSIMQALTVTEKSWLLAAVTAMSLICFPWQTAYNNLIPANYLATHADTKAELDVAQQEAAVLSPETLEARTAMIVNSESNSLYSRGLTYDLIPLIPVEYHVESGEDISSDMLERCREEHVYYVYFADRLIDDPEMNSSIASVLSDGSHPEHGTIYRYDEELDIITADN